jgi:hypothetical protein
VFISVVVQLGLEVHCPSSKLEGQNTCLELAHALTDMVRRLKPIEEKVKCKRGNDGGTDDNSAQPNPKKIWCSRAAHALICSLPRCLPRVCRPASESSARLFKQVKLQQRKKQIGAAASAQQLWDVSSIFPQAALLCRYQQN